MRVRSLRSRVYLGFFLMSTVISFSQTIRILNEESLDSLIYNRHGKVLLLNVWATWCEPCKEEFPDLIALSHDSNSNEIEIVAVSVDYPDEIDSKVHSFLDTLSIPFTVFVSNIASQDTFINKLNLKWNGAIPATFIYDANGIQQQFLLGKQNLTEFKKAVKSNVQKY